MSTNNLTVEETIAKEQADNLQNVLDFASTYKGRILHVTHESRSVWMDGGEYYSALVAEVWDPTTTTATKYQVCDNSSSGWHHRHTQLPTLHADATPEVTAAVEAKEAEALRVQMEEAHALDLMTVKPGKFVQVTSGRKVPVGTVGKVIAVTNGTYGVRVGIATSDRTEVTKGRNGKDYKQHLDVVWTDINNCEVLLQAMPADEAEVNALFRFVPGLSKYMTPDNFQGVWPKFWSKPMTLGLAAAYPDPDRLPGGHYGFAQLCEVLTTHGLEATISGYAMGEDTNVLDTIRALTEAVVGPVAPNNSPRKRSSKIKP